nr:MAG TPA: homing endonuclease [Caudoviricetes sp.]
MKEKNLDTRHLQSKTTLTNEKWLSVTNHPYYKVSNYGRVKNKHGKILKPRLQNAGYYFYSLYDGRGRNHQKQITCHKLVATHFLDVIDGYDINHVDGNKLNNHVDNLEYISHSDNAKHAYKLGINKGARGFKHPKPFNYNMKLKILNY